ncbi:MAG: Hpt domain-containing protein [bacterium]|nr:Hpt domain-containing protein [bacterium]
MRPAPFSKPTSPGGAGTPAGAEPASANRPAVNQNVQDRYLWQGLSTEAALRALATYMRTAPGLIEDMREALRCREWTRLAELAHAFKSSSAIVGAESLYETCNRLEEASGEGTSAEASSQLERVKGEYDRVLLSLEARDPHAKAD